VTARGESFPAVQEVVSHLAELTAANRFPRSGGGAGRGQSHDVVFFGTAPSLPAELDAARAKAHELRWPRTGPSRPRTPFSGGTASWWRRSTTGARSAAPDVRGSRSRRRGVRGGPLVGCGGRLRIWRRDGHVTVGDTGSGPAHVRSICAPQPPRRARPRRVRSRRLVPKATATIKEKPAAGQDDLFGSNEDQ
jgi:hypothetical protein